MAINTILLDLSVDPAKIVEKSALKLTIEDVLAKFIPELRESYSTSFRGGGFLSAYTAIRDSFVTVRGFPQGLVAINVEYYKGEKEEPLMSFEKTRTMETQMRFSLSSSRSKLLPPVRRGARFDVYLNSSDERILEYDIDDVVFEQQSPYQKVQIVHSTSLGNILILDELQNMSERDLIYTETLMQRGKEDYTDKEIVILGGGDGGLLYELLKSNPKYVTMLELDEVVMKACKEHLRSICGDCLDQMEGSNYKLDEVVMKACKEHLRSICGDCLDQMEGSNYKIVIGDCMKSLDELIADGKKVDYVFGDLTDIPVSTTPQGEVWDFIRLILNKSLQILKPTGKYMTHGNGVSSPASLAMFEEQLSNLAAPVEFSTDKAFIPSFLEEWVFYQIWPKQVN